MRTPRHEGHPIIVCFGDAAAANYPLILIVGREPNCDQPVCDTVGTYDFRNAPRCGFWNASYALTARVVNLTTGQLKQRCVQLRGSPLLYADAMPQGLLNSIPNKKLVREKIGEDRICLHVNNIFGRPILERVKLVILSGLGYRVFDSSRALFMGKCAERSISCIDLPFFSNQNAPRISQKLDPESQALMASVVSTFLASGEKQAAAG